MRVKVTLKNENELFVLNLTKVQSFFKQEEKSITFVKNCDGEFSINNEEIDLRELRQPFGMILCWDAFKQYQDFTIDFNDNYKILDILCLNDHPSITQIHRDDDWNIIVDKM